MQGMRLREVKRLIDLCLYEDELYCCGYNRIAGVDEAGRGSLAGPIIAAAVILDRKKMIIEQLNDSKKLSSGKRNRIFRKIIKSCICWSFAKISPAVIDRINIGKANLLVMRKAVIRLKVRPDLVITDAFKIDLDHFKLQSIPITKGDELSVSIAAASVIAKVIRDRIMLKYSRIYPEYDLENNKGYGTKKHFQLLKEVGPSKIHRISFKGVLKR